MATTHTSKNRVYLFRLQTLIIDGGLLVLRNILDQKLNVKNICLSACLYHERSTIMRLKGQNNVTQVQYDLLYPPGGKPPSTADFDITLIICLLRNLKTCGLNRQFNWNSVPNSQDVSVEADIYRLKLYRNEISHISTTTGIQLNDFCCKWTKIEQILLRLNASVINPVPSLQQTIDDLKTKPLDEEAEERIQKEVDGWRKLEKGVEADLKRANLDIQSIKEEMKQQQKGARQIAEKVDVMDKRTSKQQSEERQMAEKVDEIDKRMSDQQTDVRQMAEKVGEIDRRTSDNTELIKDTQKEVADLGKQVIKHLDTKGKQKVHKELNTPEGADAADKYRHLKKQLKDDLITFYKDRHSSIPLSPLFEERDTPLVDFYVLPQMKEVRKACSRGEEIKNLSDVFKSGSNRSREIYLTADAGFGKTAFSKYLAVTWCQAHRPDDKYTEYFSKDATNAISEYEFLFLVLLRDSSEDCSIDEMIGNQILQNISRSSSMKIDFLQEILHNERCLVILDGLDEWTHTDKKCSKVPKSIPHRNAREKCTVLTTTRPWKLSVINLNSRQVDKKVELVNLTPGSAQTLKENAISKIKDVDIGEAKLLAKSLDEDIKKNRLESLESIPLLLTYLVCLWLDDVPLEQSKCGLFASIIELLLSRTLSKYLETEPTYEPSQTDIIQCFSEHIQCKKNYTLLKYLGKLALETLMSKTKEKALVFDLSTAQKYLSQDDLNLCLRSGILTQSKEQVKLTKQTSRVSFSHKTVQEYFCALHISCQNESDVRNIVLHNCSNIQNILDMSTVFVFISGMNAKIISSISRELVHLISADKITSIHRSIAYYDHMYTSPVKDIQNMYISCLKENPDNSDLKLLLQDFIIEEDCREESYFTDLKHLAIHNINNIESIMIRNTGICSLHEIIDSYRLTDLYNIRKIFYQGEFQEEEISRLLNRSVECVSLVSREWQDDEFIVKHSSCSSKLCKTFQNNSLLRAIDIHGFAMDHDVLKEFLNSIINRKSMSEIGLIRLDCITHTSSCPGFNLDFSQHLDLRTLRLFDIPVLQLEVNVSALQDCDVGRLSKPGVMTSYLRSLPEAGKLQSIECCYLDSSSDIETMLQTLPLLVQVKVVKLSGIDLGERLLSLSPEMVNIEYVRLWKVKMPALTLRGVAAMVQKLSQTVIVDIRGCNITPETEFEDVKKSIQTSKNFVVNFNGINKFKQYAFEFQTIKS